MTEMVCPEPGCPREQHEAGTPFCPDHTVDWVPADRKPPAAGNGGATGEAGSEGGAGSQGGAGPAGTAHPQAPPGECWNCGEPAPAAGGTTCLACAEPLMPALALKFRAGHVMLERGEQVLLGRAGGPSPYAHLFPVPELKNVSRRHATIGVGDEGSAWIRDEDSLNGTFVNDQPDSIPLRVPWPLAHGDRVRLGADATAEVYMYRETGESR